MNDNFSKKYGQVFLKDHNIALKEVSFLSPEDNECILEIGPGHGILTEQLLKYNINLTVVEPDHRFVDQLNQSYNNFIKKW
ncbi:rRNA adenine N-6-methyltransferase family protein [Acidiplasma cupricumulans]|uniref:rRNA adenine N-6-methyltransferase family protein n=1 Tax=Acidiplasma cupricumulans TaxID=312540 RepID=UPI0007803609|nr:rRNA adenine N-6-methyltransferase family protein [Acidiplasma cupricumulans]